MSIKKKQVIQLLKGIETGDPKSVEVVNENQYIQHNPLTREGNIGLAELFKRLANMSPKVELVRVFEDGDFVFAHTDYDFNVVDVGFEIFRFEEGFIVEHWDNLQNKAEAPNLSGHTMIDGSTEILDVDKTEQNRSLIKSFVKQVLINKQFDQLQNFINKKDYTEHNSHMNDGFKALKLNLLENQDERNYIKNHRVLAEGNFVLSVCEGYQGDNHVSYYDLFRLDNDQIVEHWDTVDRVPPQSEWVNDNGKF